MDQEYILTVEELSFSLAYCGYDGMAVGMIKENLGEISEEGLELVFQTAARSLYTKGILLELNEEVSENSFIEGFKELLTDLASSTKMLRCYNETENGQFILTVHQGQKGNVYHLVSNEIVHVLSYMENEGLSEEINTFFHPALSAAESKWVFSCSDEQFQSLLEAISNGGRIIEIEAQGSQSAVEEFIRDFRSVDGNLVNMAIIAAEEVQLPAFIEVYLLLIGNEKTWLIRNENPDKDEEPRLTIETINELEWKKHVHSFIGSI